MSVQNTGSSTQTQRALYLPGLELRSIKAVDKETENLEVISATIPTNIRSSSKNKTCCRLWNYKRHYFFYNEKQR
ncbi:hypothetical protein AH448_18830 [Salmonella enterica subsp. diarizonae]|uniref:Uncharacterized protein n=2 Tax=Salmonella enterica TaxID=28901 RepID=A0A7Z0Y111_SALDZ|nr:hypothetical protein [Salmonella enterica subsp. diarizonae]EAA8950863.1 hypothetical protein [Salmonella enterica]OSG80095.1 hypothetical protein R545_23645 [Salmonella enterica subsp. diarizonae serovar Rough:r:z]PUF02189.1 hypothetical protein DAX90_24365 [Salmonella enterica subsp. enterica]PUU54511.1 hypothetical protein BUJ13_024795 [Salmonella enterica subsp. diarizonae serovar 60:r:e,n,x,z15]